MLGSLCGGDVKEGAQSLLNATHLQQLAPQTLVAFLGSHIPRSGDVAAQQGLQSFLDAAASSLALPNVLHKVGATVSPRHAESHSQHVCKAPRQLLCSVAICMRPLISLLRFFTIMCRQRLVQAARC